MKMIMKKILSVLLAAASTCGLAACASSGNADESVPTSQMTEASDATDAAEACGLRVGFGQVNITPDYSVPLQGFGNTAKRMSTGYQDYIYTTCIAVSDEEGNTVLLFANDLCTSEETITEKARTVIREATGIPEDHIMISASHTHSGPDTSNTAVSAIETYNESLVTWFLEAAEKALEDRKPARMFVASADAPGFSFVRHYILEDGTYAGDNYGHFKESPIAGHETEVDSELQLVKFTREGGKDIVMANFRGHATQTGGATKYNISADVVGAFRAAMEAELDCQCIYFNGAGGNVNCSSRIASESFQGTYRQWGGALAQIAIRADYNPVESGKVQTRQRMLTITINHSKEEYIDVCREISKVWSQTGDAARCREMGAPYGINSPYHSNAILTRSRMGLEESVEIDAISIGDVAFVAAPYEMFDTNGMEIKEGSPYATTFIMTCANQSNSYVPSALNWEHGSYAVDMSRYAGGTAELLVENYVSMLNDMHTKE